MTRSLDALHEDNRRSWNAATRAHNSHKVDQARFLREGGSTLFPEEVELLGDLEGRKLLHLLCNSGQDSLSLVQRGARVTGVDLSDEAVAFARGLSEDSGLAATFHHAEALAWLDEARVRGDRFDRVFCSYGALCWISNLERLARGIADLLVPGGRFVAVEFHPFVMVFGTDWRPAYPYFHREPWRWEDGITDYVGASGGGLSPSGHQEGIRDFRNPHPSHEFLWTLADVVTSLLKAGLHLEVLREYPYANGWKGFEDLREGEGHRFYPPEGISLPLMYAVAARKPG